ncbi:hypothetical protein EDD15DRAFT_2199633 [Pisolithus albus]|nr:hypothetical protein EDD15DRAFT_2199633 [Pisolithus albus]
MADSDHNSSRRWEELSDWLDMLAETSQLVVPPVVAIFCAMPSLMLICLQDPHGFHYWITRALVSERQHLDTRLSASPLVVLQTWSPVSDADTPVPAWLRVAPGHIIRSFVCMWSVVPLFTVVAFHEMDNYPNCAAILRWAAAFEASIPPTGIGITLLTLLFP